MMIFVMFFLSIMSGAANATLSQVDIDRINCVEVAKQGECLIYGVSILNLIATPERFDGKRIRVSGILSVGQEHIVLRLSKDTSTSEAIWLSIQDGTYDTKADFDRYNLEKKRLKLKLDNRRVWVEGVFNMNFHHPLFRGKIMNITRID